MDLSQTVPLIALLSISVLYAAFDLFNNRNVPDIFAYASVVLGLVITVLYHADALTLSILIALLMAAVGYIIYRMGMWGAGDYFELVAISLILPFQPTPLFGNGIQFGFPFILSVFVAAGFAAIWIVPIYYLLVKRRRWSWKLDTKRVLYSASMFILYMILFLFTYFITGFSATRLAMILFVAIPSCVMIVFEEEITSRMVERVYPKQLEDGDIIAVNMMTDAEKKYFSKYRGFERLATNKLIEKLRNAKKKLPVYKNAAPFAVFILIGVVISLLVGNLILFVV